MMKKKVGRRFKNRVQWYGRLKALLVYEYFARSRIYKVKQDKWMGKNIFPLRYGDDDDDDDDDDTDSVWKDKR